MGIKYLNSYLKRKCNTVLPKIELWDLRGKTVVIDASIYMYRFAAQDSLMEGMYQLTMLLLDHRITPIYVFDGAPPPEKAGVIQRRRQDRIRAETKLAEMELTNDTKRIQLYKRRATRIRRSEVDEIKRLLTACGVEWYQAAGEADQLCVHLVTKGTAWACLSEDMDMLVYGCERVLRYLSIFRKTVVLYQLSDILSTLQIPFEDFQQICVRSGTDYQKGENLFSVLTKYESGALDKVDASPFHIPDSLEYERKGGSSMNRSALHDVLKNHGFVFVNET